MENMLSFDIFAETRRGAHVEIQLAPPNPAPSRHGPLLGVSEHAPLTAAN